MQSVTHIRVKGKAKEYLEKLLLKISITTLDSIDDITELLQGI